MILLRSILFNGLFYTGTVIFCILGLPVLLATRRIGGYFGHYWALWTLWLATWTVGLRYEVRGRKNLPAGPAIIAIKHQSAWDTFAAAALFEDPAIIVKRELLAIPFYGWYLRKAGMIGIDRDIGAAAMRRMLKAARAAVAQGRSILIFPEGTRTPVGFGRTLSSGRRGAGPRFEAAAGAGGAQFRPVLGAAPFPEAARTDR